jgi:hypothetical protein
VHRTSPGIVSQPSCRRCAAIAVAAFAATTTAQEPPELVVGRADAAIAIDGRLDDAAWAAAPVATGFRTVEPVEGGAPHGDTELRVLADAQAVYFGIRCRDAEPAAIVAHAVARDADLSSEDHVKLVLGTFGDGRTGYVFAVNPRGARYDALIASRGESEDRDWDGPWQARANVDEQGWTAELRLPVDMLTFASGAGFWHCNVERKVQRLLERSRWANPHLDQRVTMTARAGRLVAVPRFDLGLGLAVRGALVASTGRPTAASSRANDLEPSCDIRWRISPELTAVLTANTDFAETEADARRTNLTRFPLFFPEKRAFFLEGADAFDFGLGTAGYVRPFHSRRIGLVDGNEVPLVAGLKGIGRFGGTSLGALLAQTGAEADVAPVATMGVLRVRQDVGRESNVGLFGTAGDPQGGESAMVGADATYQTSELFGGRNFLAGVWGLAHDLDGPGGRASSWGVKLDYPNDDWDIALTAHRVDADFAPPLGYVQRAGIYRYRLGVDHVVRPGDGLLRKLIFESSNELVTDLDGRWESWRAFTAPLNLVFESGDGVEFNVIGEGERFAEDFAIGDGVVIPGGSYEWLRYRAVVAAAEKRAVAGEIAWYFGDFYDGSLDQVELDGRWVVGASLTLGLAAEFVRGRLPQGRFAEDLYALRASLTLSPDLTIDSFVQYDTESDRLGANTRLRWDFTPDSQLFVVVNWNVQDPRGQFRSDGDETALKLQHEVRF